MKGIPYELHYTTYRIFTNYNSHKIIYTTLSQKLVL